MSLTIRAQEGYDYRDEPGDRRGAHGLRLGFTALGERAGVRYACSLDVSTHWMARPLAGDAVTHGRPQLRRDKPGLDGTRPNDPSPAVHMCCPVDARVPDYFAVQEGNGCPWFGGSCTGNVGYLIGDQALTVLLEDGEDALEAWLHECAASWLAEVDGEPAS